MKFGQNFCLDEISDKFENGSCRLKNWVTRSNPRKTLYMHQRPDFCLILLKLGQSVCNDEILYMFENGSCWVTRSNHRRSYACTQGVVI